jgi:hypothetical protein
MTSLHLLEVGKAQIENDRIKGTAQVIVNADGTKPRMLASFDDTLNELVGELVLVHQWNKNLPTHFTIGRNLRHDYADALNLKRGVFILKSTLKEDYNFDIELSFIDSSTPQFQIVTFKGIDFDATKRVIALPKCATDDHEVFLEEVLVGMLNPAFQAATQRCMRLDFVNRLHHAFTLNKYGVPVDQRNREVEQIRR